MSTTTLNSTIGLGYLNDQQRYMRAQVATGPRSIDIITDVRPAAMRQMHMQQEAVRTSVLLAHKRVEQALPQIVPNQSEAVNVFVDQLHQTVKTKHRFARRYAPIVVASAAVVIGLGILGLSLKQNHQAAAQVASIAEKAESSTTTGSSNVENTPPSETPLAQNALSSYAVAADMPRLISIKKISVTARVLPMGVLSNGAMATPKNTNDTGWYNASSKPGENGASLIVGHMSGATTGGIFYNLKKLEAGDIITVERGDKTKIEYKVVKKEVLAADKVDMASLLVSVTPGRAGLNLMTCAGKYDAKTETFNDREIIYAQQV